MTFKQTMKEEARKRINRELGEWSSENRHRLDIDLDTLIETTINATLKEVEESLGEEKDNIPVLPAGQSKPSEYHKAGKVVGHNTLHRKVRAKLLELSK